METESIHPPGASTGPLRRAPLAHVFAPFVPLGGHRNCGSQVEGSDVPVSVRQRFPGGDCPPTAIEISSWPRRNQRWWGERTRETIRLCKYANVYALSKKRLPIVCHLCFNRVDW